MVRGGPVRFVGTQQGGNMNRGIIGTIIGVLVIIVLVLVIRQMM
jgi:tetrahydromethanopterin S-methyltransferase subunit F